MVGDSEEEEEGPPPGWEIVEAEAQPPTPPTPTLPFSPTDIYMGIEQLEVQEEEGPPPGWHIIPPQSNMGNEKIDDEEEGPPPGWDSPPKPEQQTGHENNEIDEERHPPSWHFVPLPESEIGNGHQDIEGPPPGWPSMPPTQQNITIEKREIEVGTELGSHFVPSPQIRISSELEAVYNKEIGIHYERSSIDPLQPIVEYKQEDIKEEDTQTGSNYIPLPQPRVTSPMVPPLQLPFSDTDTKSEQEVADEEGPPPGWHLVKPNKANSEHQGIQEGASCGWASPAKPKKELEKHDFIEGAGEEGPPPWWHSIKQNKMNSEHLDVKKEASRGWTSAANPKTELEKQDILEGAEEERPLPGWHSIEQNKINNEYQDIEEGASRGWTSSAKPITELEKHNIIEEGTDEEGPPPGWHLIEQNKINSEHQDIKEGASRGCTSPEKLKGEIDKQDIIDEGPPPGWNLMPPPQRKAGSENQAIKSEGPPHGSHSCPPPQPKLVGIKQDIGEERPQHSSNSVCQQPKMGQGPQEVKKEGSQPGLKSMPPPPSQIRPPMPPMSTASKRPTQSGNQLEMGQMVCGFCRRLLSYARGAKYVQCSSCQTVNLVLEAHQVGQVKCGGCEVLLMYQFGAGAVQCASCRHVTDIGVQNRRPPLSAQQARGRRRQNFNR